MVEASAAVRSDSLPGIIEPPLTISQVACD